jgi:DNA helicase-2/ATP-dependent DNA helicase PcrA
MELNKRAIPYVVRGGVRFFEQAHIKDVLAFLRLFNNVKDEISLKRILMMCDGIGQTTAHKIYEMVKYCGDIKDLLLILKNYKSREKVRNSLSKIIGILDKIILLRQNIIQESITTVLQNGYETYLRANFDNYQDRLRDLEQLGVFSSQYNSVDDFLSDASLTESFKGEKNLDNTHREDELTVSSIHQAKGLEWDVVFVISLINGYFPHYKVYDNPLEFSEERRLFYVACTRAKKNLYCIYPIISRGVLSDCKINRPSDFITEVNEKVFEKWHIYGTEKLMNSLSNDKNRTVENKNFSKNHYKYNKVDNKENLYKENNEAAVYDIEDVKNTKSILGKVAKMNQKNYKHLGNSWDEDGFFQEETIEYD